VDRARASANRLEFLERIPRAISSGTEFCGDAHGLRDGV
jgi:hypothetical protein